jgi:hypothetical protein
MPMTDKPGGKRRKLALALTVIGLGIFALGTYLEARTPRSNNADNFALCVLAVGAILTGMGASLRSVRPWLAIAIGIASPFIVFALTVAVVFSVIYLEATLRSH